MAILFTKDQTLVGQRQRQQFFIVVLLVVFLVMSFVLWIGFFKKSSPQAVSKSSAASAPRKVEIDFSLLQNKIFDTLEFPPQETKAPEAYGRDNPFVPF